MCFWSTQCWCRRDIRIDEVAHARMDKQTAAAARQLEQLTCDHLFFQIMLLHEGVAWALTGLLQ